MRRLILFFIALLLLPVFLLKQPPAVSQILSKKENKVDTTYLNIDSIKIQNLQIIDSLNENLSIKNKSKAINLYKKIINSVKN